MLPILCDIQWHYGWKHRDLLADFNDHSNILLMPTAATMLLLPVPGRVVNLLQILKLACGVNKATNLTAQMLGALNKTLTEVRTALLQSWLALDYPLLKKHQGAQLLSGLYCLNLSDYCQQINIQLKQLLDTV